jgi:hypothetical protein
MMTMIHALMMDLDTRVVQVGILYDDNDPRSHDAPEYWSSPGGHSA